MIRLEGNSRHFFQDALGERAEAPLITVKSCIRWAHSVRVRPMQDVPKKLKFNDQLLTTV